MVRKHIRNFSVALCTVYRYIQMNKIYLLNFLNSVFCCAYMYWYVHDSLDSFPTCTFSYKLCSPERKLFDQNLSGLFLSLSSLSYHKHFFCKEFDNEFQVYSNDWPGFLSMILKLQIKHGNKLGWFDNHVPKN